MALSCLDVYGLRPVDGEGEVLDLLVQWRRDEAAAEKLIASAAIASSRAAQP